MSGLLCDVVLYIFRLHFHPAGHIQGFFAIAGAYIYTKEGLEAIRRDISDSV
jgi:hypothetical protein